MGAGCGSVPRLSAHPSTAQRTGSGDSRFLHRFPPLTTGVGDVSAAAVHGAWLAAAPPGRGRPCPRDPAATGTGFHLAVAAPPVLFRGDGGDTAPQKPRGFCSPARPGARPRPGTGGRGPGRLEAQVPSLPAEAAPRCPQVRRRGWRRSLGCLFEIPAWVARCGGVRRDRRCGPLGEGGAAALRCSRDFPDPGCFPPAELGLRPPLRVPPASARLCGYLWSEPVVPVTLSEPSIKWTRPAMPPAAACTG